MADSDMRSLVVQTGWQTAAEDFLIGLFRPVWNKQTGICFAFGKHGDSPSTRANQRSPWDTLHPGRSWEYRDPNMRDARPKERIVAAIRRHYATTPVYRDMDEIVNAFMADLRDLR